MIQLKSWQWVVLALPFLSVLGFLGIAAGFQIHQWGLNWIWAVIAVMFLVWRFLLVRWTTPTEFTTSEITLNDLGNENSPTLDTIQTTARQQAETEIQKALQEARDSSPPWEDWTLFAQQCQALVEAIALIYHPQSKRPLLNIYVPQAYGLLRGTVDDVDQWMQKLSPLLGQVTIGQAYAAYETYQKLEPTARFTRKAWNWAQWVFNPVVALARSVTQGYWVQANQQLVTNLGQLVREATLKALGERAIALYSGEALQSLTLTEAPPTVPQTQTQTLRDIFAQASPPTTSTQTPLNIILVGRTGAGKSNLINTLFRQNLATVDVLPSTQELQPYTFNTHTGDTLLLWDTPGYEQVGIEPRYAQAILDQATTADLVLLVTPAHDPTLQMDLEQVRALKLKNPDLPILAIVTQVDRLRPFREWEPPYDWHNGDRPKEQNIRAAIEYQKSILKNDCINILPLVTENQTQGRSPWGEKDLSQAILQTLEPAQEIRLSRFLRNLETRTQTATQIINRYVTQMGTVQGIAAVVKSPLLHFLSTLLTGSPTLAILLTEKIPLETTPIILGKLQMAFELHELLSPSASKFTLEVLTLWTLILKTSTANDANAIAREAWALGQTLVEYWTHPSPPKTNEIHQKLFDRHQFYLNLSAQ